MSSAIPPISGPLGSQGTPNVWFSRAIENQGELLVPVRAEGSKARAHRRGIPAPAVTWVPGPWTYPEITGRSSDRKALGSPV